MSIDYICGKVAKLKKKYGDIGPEELCEELGINILRIPLGSNPDDCKGFFFRRFRISRIVLNSCLSARNQTIILYHELGHAILHANGEAECLYDDLNPFDESGILEHEANIFAAEYALSDEDVLEALNDDSSFFTAARKLRVPPELLDFKFRVLKHKGYALNAPYVANSTFMKDIGR